MRAEHIVFFSINTKILLIAADVIFSNKFSFYKIIIFF